MIKQNIHLLLKYSPIDTPVRNTVALQESAERAIGEYQTLVMDAITGYAGNVLPGVVVCVGCERGHVFAEDVHYSCHGGTEAAYFAAVAVGPLVMIGESAIGGCYLWERCEIGP